MYGFNEQIRTVRKLRELLCTRKAILFGTGLVARELLDKKYISVSEIAFFIDNYREGYVEIEGNLVSINKPDVLCEHSANEYFVVIASSYVEPMLEQLSTLLSGDQVNWDIIIAPLHDVKISALSNGSDNLKNLCIKFYAKLCADEGLKDAYDIALFFASKMKFLYSNSERLIVPRIVHVITNRCTLRCKECCNLIPKFQTTWMASLDEIKRDTCNFLDVVDGVIYYELIGGEAFLHPQLSDIIKFLCAQEKIEKIEITTNGTIIPSVRLLQDLQNSKIIVRINEYHVGNKTKIIIQNFKKFDIAYSYINDLVWMENHLGENRHMTQRDVEEELNICGIYEECKTIQNGYLFPCGAAAVLDDFYDGAMKTKEDALKLEEVSKESNKEKRTKMLNLYRKEYINSCNYCNFGGGIWTRRVRPGEQIDES